MGRYLLRLVVVGVVLCSRSQAHGGDDKPPRKAGSVTVESARLRSPNIAPLEFELGTLTVPENRAEPASRLIGVGFARFKSTADVAAPPVFLLPGGPGSSYLKWLKPGVVSPGLVRQIERYRRAADVVLVDQRGYSERGDELVYRYRTPDEPLDEPADSSRAARTFAEQAREAVREFEAQKIDLRGYTVVECADDVDDLRRALGYEQITLVGTSFGSQWGFAVMRRHPDRVARALFSGVEPLDHGYDMPSHVQAALARMWFEAEKNPRFRPHLPEGGIAAAARAVADRLAGEPVRVTLHGPSDPRTGPPPTVTLGLGDFQRDPTLRSPDGPAFILSLYHGRYGRWAQSVYQRRRGRPAELPLVAPLIDTSLGVTPRRRNLLEHDPAVALLGRWSFESYLATADIWPSPDVGDAFRTPEMSPIPVVFVQGDWDLQTPLENALAIAPYFPNGRLLVVERGGHGVMGQLDRARPDTMAALVRFLATGKTGHLPVRIDVPAPPFAVPELRVVK